jgi:hypothetical protein
MTSSLSAGGACDERDFVAQLSHDNPFQFNIIEPSPDRHRRRLRRPRGFRARLRIASLVLMWHASGLIPPRGEVGVVGPDRSVT